MLKRKILAVSMIFIAIGFMGCKSSVEKDNGEGDGNSFVPNKMIKITGNTTIPDFYISNTELTYSKWYEVYQWATSESRGEYKYEFTYFGREGTNDVNGAAPINNRQPVIYISWRDAIVWCNAASEKEGFTPVYYLQGTTNFTSDKVVRQSEKKDKYGSNINNKTNADEGKSMAELAEINESADGYRLPTKAIWIYASLGGEDYDFSGSNDCEEIAWIKTNSESVIHDVGTKNPNKYELFDMTGNVSEFCQDKLSDTSTNRIYKGGDYTQEAMWCGTTSSAGNCDTYSGSLYRGFRPIRIVQ